MSATRRRLIGYAAALATLAILVLGGWWQFAQPSPARNAPSKASVNPERLEVHVRQLAETFVPRDHRHPENLARTADYIAGEFERTGARIERRHFEQAQMPYQNLHGFFGPEPSSDSAARLIIGAHYDAFEAYPGADDNASAVAGLIELAYLLGQSEGSLKRPVELVSWPLEEPPYFRTDGMGSAVHAGELRASGVAIRLMICLDMIGYFSDEAGSQKVPFPLLRLYYPSKGNFIAVVGNTTNRRAIAEVKATMRGSTPLPVHSICGPKNVPGIDFSDHLNFWKNGYPAVMISDTAFYRNDHYHTPNDTPDTLDYERMSQVIVGLYEVAKAL